MRSHLNEISKCHVACGKKHKFHLLHDAYLLPVCLFFFFKLAGNKRTQTILKLDFSPLLLQKRIEVFSGVLK